VNLRAIDDEKARRGRAASSPALAHRQPFLAAEPVDAVLARRLALLPQQNEQPPIAEAPAGVGEIAQLGAQFRIRRPPRRIAHGLADQIDNGTGSTLRQAHDGPKVRDSFALDGGSYHFFNRSSRIAAASNI
jgi:hypothetical protein